MNYPTDPLKIIIAVHHFPPSFKGGAEWRAHRTAKWLQSQGHTAKVICVEAVDDTTTPNLRWADEEFDSVMVRRLYLNLPNAPDPTRWEYDNLWIESHLTNFLTEEQPDIFHLISGYLMTGAAIRAAKQLDIPVILTLTDFWFICHRHTLYRTAGQVCGQNTALDCVRCNLEQQRRFRLPAQKLPNLTNRAWHAVRSLPTISKQTKEMNRRNATLQAALTDVDVAVCPSNFLRQTYLDKGFTAQKMQFLRQGLRHIPPLPLEKEPSPQVRIAYIGQIGPHKGVQVLVEAFLKLSAQVNGSAVLKLYGDTEQFGGFYDDLQSKIARSAQNGTAGRQIQFLGTFDNQQINQIYQEIDVLVVPSIWYENSPNVILEAFAHQTPVIASNLGGMAELVTDNKTGLLFAPNNAEDLARKLKAVLDDPAVLQGWQANITSPSALETEMAELLQIYQSTLFGTDNANNNQ